MVLKKSLLGMCLLYLTTLPVQAVTYDVDLVLDDYTYESVDGKWIQTYGADPVSIIGQIETDGTTGTLDASNILSWSFTISSTSGNQDFSSEGLFGQAITYGTFEATETSVFGGDDRWGFLEYVNVPTSYVIGRVHGQNGNLHTYANFQDLDVDCSTGECLTTTNKGNRGIERNLQLLGTSSVITAQVVTNPVPASLPLIVSGFSLLGFLAWRRRRMA